MHGRHLTTPDPLAGYPHTAFRNSFIARPNIDVGDCTCHDDASGDGAIVAARSVVASDVPAHAIIAGNLPQGQDTVRRPGHRAPFGDRLVGLAGRDDHRASECHLRQRPCRAQGDPR